jgi:hypothetical protein
MKSKRLKSMRKHGMKIFLYSIRANVWNNKVRQNERNS